MAYYDSTEQYQRMLTNYIRTGIEPDLPGSSQEGIKRYRQLIYNVVNDSLNKAYPLTQALLSAEEWDQAVKEYFSSYACRSPFLWRMPFEFYEYVKNDCLKLNASYPFLSDLLLFEWVEIEVFMMEDIEVAYTTDGNILFSRLVLNPACILQYFQYPVYKKDAKEIEEIDRANYFMLTYRHPETNKVHFLEISPMFAKMLEYLSEESQTLDQLTDRFSKESGLIINSQKKNEIEDFLRKCCEKRILLGYY
ncbi:MAG: HvfC/BufC N-terminal domain-containing protein [Cytophaga sp.]|uniref:HvfC/BufC N-terminal domain-containing protein n=1 Tax=Cytophaga sp. TaxID=29535 RepID=UPI003F7F27A8